MIAVHPSKLAKVYYFNLIISLLRKIPFVGYMTQISNYKDKDSSQELQRNDFE